MAERDFDSSWRSWSELVKRPDAEPIEVLRAAARFQDYFGAVEREAIKAARARGRTWEEIGQAVGRSRQAVWQRFRDRARLDPAEARRWMKERTTAFAFVPPPRLSEGP